MSTIADYSVFTKAFLASGMTDFSQLYGNKWSGEEVDGSLRALAVIPFNLPATLTPREAMNFDWSKLDLSSTNMARRVSCRDADGNFIGNIVRVQPSQRNGAIRLVAKVAVTDLVSSEGGSNPADAPYNTFVLVRTNASTSIDLPIAVATISKGYNLHKHKVVVNVNDVENPYGVNFADPLDDVENANYVSFTINNLNGYTSVDFNPDAYATYDDVANALSRGIDGLHIAFDTASGDLKLLDKDGNVLDQANLPIKTDVIIADGEEGYKYVKTNVKQDIHAAKAWMPEGKTAWEAVEAVPYKMQHAALVVGNASSREFVLNKTDVRLTISTQTVEIPHVGIGGSTYMLADLEGSACKLFRVKGDAGSPAYYDVSFSENIVTITDASTTESASHDVHTSDVDVDVITFEKTLYVLGETGNTIRRPGETSETSEYRALPTNSVGDKYIYGAIETSGGSSTGGVVGITLDKQSMYTFDETAETSSKIKDSSGHDVTWFGTKTIPEGYTLKYGLEAFVWTVKGEEVEISDPFFKKLNASLLALGFHEGDDIALGEHIGALSEDLNGVDADEYIHGKDKKAIREQEVDAQRANAKEELVAWNAQHPALKENRQDGTIIDSSGLDVRNGRITLGCGRVGEEGVFQKVNYGIQMGKPSGDGVSESLDFTISHHTGLVVFNENGHATNLTSSTLLSIDSDSYISGAPTCLILAEVTHNSDQTGGPTVVRPVRTTAGFSVAQNYDASSGLRLTLQDDRNNIKALLSHGGTSGSAPAIIEVQALYTHPNAETVPAQQMHTYIGSWDYSQTHPHPVCSFLCNKIEEWMTAVGLANTNPDENVKLYVVIRVY